MTSIFPKRKSPLGQLKNQFFGNAEQSLKEAYEAASKIKSIENHYFSGYRIPVESLQNDQLQEEVLENLAILQRRLEEFNASNSGSGKPNSNQLEKLIFAEGIFANYAVALNQPSALVPLPQDNQGQSSLSTPNIADVPSTTNRANPAQQKRKSGSSSTGGLPGGAFPGGLPGSSVSNAFSRIKQDLNPKSEQEVVDEFRRSRQVTVIGVRLLALLIIVPILSQQLSKHFLFAPIVDQYRGGDEAVITIDKLNSEWKEEALSELNAFEEELKMDHLLRGVPPMAPEIMEEKVQEKANEIAEEFDNKRINAISNVFADLVALFAFAAVLIMRRKDINVLKSFIDKIVYGLSDSAKAFGIILFTDMFVGFHSPHGWEVLLEGLANHLGIAASHSGISLFIATVPVFMDTMMKYWIFKYLSQLSASTVATLKEMNE
ncbi:MAG: proton extrusion protein PcxA [Xenococcus sp. MO_188.B8]|nr:proton extrusion protein PcxA [Xenococcus sp. MO_188.B8]